MIIRHIPMRDIKRSSFKGLIEYLIDPQDKNERVGKISVTHCANCDTKDLTWAIHEIEATQAQNQRATGDRTYHMLISFPSEDNLNEAMLSAIEARVCKSLGFEQHQHISVIHYDTDNTHIHVAINKIHPKKFTMHEPYLAYKTMAKVAVDIEKTYGLQHTNHIPKRRGSQSKAKDMEHHAGIESLITWIQKNCLAFLQQAVNWNEFHQILQNHQLNLKKQGNGFIIMNAQGLTIKASSVARNLSKKNLEGRLGEFQPAQASDKKTQTQKIQQKPGIGKIGQKPPKNRQHRFSSLNRIEAIQLDSGMTYQFQPLKKTPEAMQLYAQYEQERQKTNQNFSYEVLKFRAQRNQAIEKALKNANLKHAAVKFFKNSAANKRLLYALIHKQLKADIEKANMQYRHERQSKSYERMAWVDWLVKKAEQGNEDALKTLQARTQEKNTKYNAFSGTIQNQDAFLNPQWDSITKQGTVIYHCHDTSIRDNGSQLFMPHGYNKEGLKTALQMAMQRYGENITIQGDMRFKTEVVKASLDFDLNFTDAILQTARQKLIQQKKIREKHHARRNLRSHTRRSAQSIRANLGRKQIQYESFGNASKSNLGRVGRKPPSTAQNRLRSLSELGMVQLTARSEMLLSRHVSHHLEHQRTQSTHKLRRDVSGRGVNANAKKVGRRRKR